MAPELALPPGRYGRAPSVARRRAALALAGFGVLASLAWVVWAGLGQSRDPVHWTDVGFTVQGDTSVSVTYDLAKPPGDTVVCTLRALDVHKSTVGIARVTVGPTGERVTRRTDVVRTSALPVTGTVRSCAPSTP